MSHTISQFDKEPTTASVPSAGFSDQQFAELKALLIELLTPGYECAKLYLAQAQAAQATKDPTPEVE